MKKLRSSLAPCFSVAGRAFASLVALALWVGVAGCQTSGGDCPGRCQESACCDPRCQAAWTLAADGTPCDDPGIDCTIESSRTYEVACTGDSTVRCRSGVCGPYFDSGSQLDAKACDPEAGNCTSCTSDGDCPGAAYPACDTTQHLCVACTPPGNHCAAGLFCLTVAGSYACGPGCATDEDCTSSSTSSDDGGGHPDGGAVSAGGLVRCDTSSHQCVACLGDADCPMGRVCVPAGSPQAGTCADGCNATHACSSGETCCGAICSDLTSDAANCSGCGVACPSGFNCCVSACVDPSNDLQNCGGCGIPCSFDNATTSCATRSCVLVSCDAGYADCDRIPKDGCEVELATDAANCGTCGKACSISHAQAACTAGQCVIGTCLQPWADCDHDGSDGCEVDLMLDDPMNCGACGIVCASPNAQAVCMAALCGYSTCDAGFDDCDGSRDNGCETDLSSSDSNCGACGKRCSMPHAQSSCADSVCVLGPCDAGWADCDGEAANGCETNTEISGVSCGGCGVVCNAAHATSSCASGQCQMSCDPGYGDCDGLPANGCESNLGSSDANCNACGIACAPDNAQGACQGGFCAIVGCDPGYANCDGDPANGCETHTDTDPEYCGSCGLTCSTANGVASCLAGACQISCHPGYGDCDHSAINGCEINLMINAANCGTCGHACTTTCVAGTCT